MRRTAGWLSVRGSRVTRTLPAPIISIITIIVCPVNHLFAFNNNLKAWFTIHLVLIELYYLRNWKKLDFFSATYFVGWKREIQYYIFIDFLLLPTFIFSWKLTFLTYNMPSISKQFTTLSEAWIGLHLKNIRRYLSSTSDRVTWSHYISHLCFCLQPDCKTTAAASAAAAQNQPPPAADPGQYTCTSRTSDMTSAQAVRRKLRGCWEAAMHTHCRQLYSFISDYICSIKSGWDGQNIWLKHLICNRHWLQQHFSRVGVICAASLSPWAKQHPSIKLDI